jgi:hypothetical protein
VACRILNEATFHFRCSTARHRVVLRSDQRRTAPRLKNETVVLILNAAPPGTALRSALLRIAPRCAHGAISE